MKTPLLTDNLGLALAAQDAAEAAALTAQRAAEGHADLHAPAWLVAHYGSANLRRAPLGRCVWWLDLPCGLEVYRLRPDVEGGRVPYACGVYSGHTIADAALERLRHEGRTFKDALDAAEDDTARLAAVADHLGRVGVLADLYALALRQGERARSVDQI